MKKIKGPWRVKSSKVVYQNPWIKVTEDQVIRPDGKPGIFGVVEQKHGVCVVPIDNVGNVYLIKEYKYAIGRISTEIVAGGVDQDETLLQAAKRELKEEAGIIAKKWTQELDELIQMNDSFFYSTMYQYGVIAKTDLKALEPIRD